jgi:hypothetical protein
MYFGLNLKVETDLLQTWKTESERLNNQKDKEKRNVRVI